MGYDFLKGLHNLYIAQPLHGCGSNANRVHLKLAGGSGNLFNFKPQCNQYQETLLIYSSQESVHSTCTPLQDKLRTISASVRDVTATEG
jgi:hypothetical protein